VTASNGTDKGHEQAANQTKPGGHGILVLF